MITLVDYKAGNLTSVQHALSEVGVDSIVTSDPNVVRKAERVIFPGVGAAGASMRALQENNLDQALREVLAAGRPFLGICVGCQILLDSSLENGGTPCLGILPGTTGVFTADAENKVPHMGWNQVVTQGDHPVMRGIPSGSDFYFVHSFYPQPQNPDHVLGRTHYAGVEFASILARDNLIACQFHAEKSGRHGLRLLANFASWNP